jgi:protein-disulfide isomerase
MAAVSRRGAIGAGLGTVLAVSARPGVAEARAFRIPSELASEALRLPGRINLGNPAADVTLVEFFDYNCGFCKRSAAEIRPLLTADRDLRYVLVNYAVLGVPSIEASRVALAASMQTIRGGYLALHERLFQLRGRVEANRALDVATDLGVDRDRLIRDADSEAVTDALRRAAQLGDSLNLAATPSFIAGTEAVVGYLDLPQKRRAIQNLRRCERMGC